MTIFAGFALAVVALGNGNVSAENGGEVPQPQPTVQYPIRFDNAPPPQIQQPQPTVSYPVRFPSRERNR